MLGSLRQKIADYGWFGTALYALDRALATVRVGRVFFYSLEVQPVPTKPLLPPHRGRQFAIRQLHPGDPALAQIPRPAAVLSTRFSQGSVGFGGFVNDELVGMIWLHIGPYAEDEVRCVFIPGDRTAWDFDVYVRPDLRSSFLFARLWDTAFAYLREKNIDSSACRVSAWNTASIQAHRRLGARSVGRVAFLVLGPLQLAVQNRAPRVLFARSARVPEIRV